MEVFLFVDCSTPGAEVSFCPGPSMEGLGAAFAVLDFASFEVFSLEITPFIVNKKMLTH